MSRKSGRALPKGRRAYTAVYERDPSGVWLVHLAEYRRCHTYGRSLAQARARIREALSLYDDAEPVVITDDLRRCRAVGEEANPAGLLTLLNDLDGEHGKPSARVRAEVDAAARRHFRR
jgi:predicted RNase H-like HicB family nuclease